MLSNVCETVNQYGQYDYTRNSVSIVGNFGMTGMDATNPVASAERDTTSISLPAPPADGEGEDE